MAKEPKTPKAVTSTSAFRAYLREVDHLTMLVERGTLSRYRALESERALFEVLEARLGYIFLSRLEAVAPKPWLDQPVEEYPGVVRTGAHRASTQQDRQSSSSGAAADVDAAGAAPAEDE